MSAVNSVRRWNITTAAQGLGLSIMAVAAAFLVVATFLAAVGLVPWIAVPIDIGGEQHLVSGRIVQIAATILLVVLCAYLPSSMRVLRLEIAHRSFQIGMDDVTRAYWAAHQADRTGIFELKREFDAVRERYLFLKNHPDLGEMESDVLELAAKMGTEARELAALYSDEKVARAHEMLTHRREDAERLSNQITGANAALREIRRSLDDVEMEENVVQAQIARLRDEFAELLEPIEHPARKGRGRGRLRVASVKGD